jgi:hypothetical protein
MDKILRKSACDMRNSKVIALAMHGICLWREPYELHLAISFLAIIARLLPLAILITPESSWGIAWATARMFWIEAGGCCRPIKLF